LKVKRFIGYRAIFRFRAKETYPNCFTPTDFLNVAYCGFRIEKFLKGKSMWDLVRKEKH